MTPFSVCSTEKWPLLRFLGQYPFRLTGNTFIEKAAVGEESFTSDTGMAGINYLYELGRTDIFRRDSEPPKYRRPSGMRIINTSVRY